MQEHSRTDGNWFRRLYELSPDPTWVIEAGRFVECNDAAVETLGYTSRDELLNLHPSQLSPPVQADGEDSFSKAEQMMSAAVANGMHRFEWIHTTANGSDIDVEVTLSSITINNSPMLYCVWRDITEQKRLDGILANERERVRSILNKVVEPIFVKDNDHRLVLANEAFYDMFAMDESLVIGNTLVEHVPENEKEQFLAVDRRVLDTGILDQREETLTLKGFTRTIITRKTRYVDNFGERFLVGSINDISERKRAEDELRKSDALFRSLANTLPVAIYVSSGIDQVCDYVNHTFVELFGYTKDEVPSALEWWSHACPDPECRQSVVDEWQRRVKLAIETQTSIKPMEVSVTCKDGSTRDVSWGFVTLGDQNYAFGLDLSEQKKAEREQAIAATAFNAQEGMVVTDKTGSFIKVNEAFSRITGYSPEEVVGKNPRLLKSGRHDRQFYMDMWDSINCSGSWEGEIWNRRKNGEVYPQLLTITAVTDAAGEVSNFVGTFNDISLSKASAEEIEKLAFYDPLTRLPNRRLLLDRLHKALRSMNRSPKKGALLFLDLDNFKNLNDSLGHSIGDVLLQQVAARLVACVRECDTVGRLGGDEFIVMLEDLSEESTEALGQANAVAGKIMASLNRPYQLDTHSYESTTSIGITTIENADQDLDELLKQADIAMYQSKKSGRNTISFFDPEMQERLNARVELEFDLYRALDDQQFELHYQMQVNEHGQPIGAEALIRWHHPRHDIVGPMDFIAYAEGSDLMRRIGNWVLDSACQMLVTLEKDTQFDDLTLSVNVSARQFHQPDFVSYIEQLIKHHGINPARLKLELTESLLLIDIEDAITRMNALKEIGICLALDDFGTGYSSLQYLKRLPLKQIKIDQSFIRDIETDASDRAIVSTIIAMARNLNVEVIAEGVETEAQKQFLTDGGCCQFQGFLFAKPVPAEQFLALLQA